MGTQTWGTGIDTFGLNFLDAVVSDSGSSEWQTADAQNYVHVAFQCKEMKSYYEDGTDTNPYHTTPNDICFNYINDGGQWKVQYNSNENKPDGFFTRSCLLYNDGNGYHVVTDVTDIQRMIWEPNVMVNTSSRSQIDGTTLSYTTYQINTTYNQGTISIEKKNDNTILTSGLTIFPWLLAPDYLTHLMNHYSTYNEDEINEWGNNVKRENATYGNGTGNRKRYRPHFALDVTQLFPNGNNQMFAIKSSDGNFICELDYSTNNYASITGRYYIASEHMLLLWIASCGLKFKWNNKIYKPIAENGVIVGYTDDMTKKSDWDNWHDFNDHVVPDTPPSGGGGNGDELTDMLSRGQFYASGLTKYYVDVPAAKLQKALGNWDNIKTGKDVLQNLLSYKILCFPSTTFSNGMTEPFIIAGTELKDENDATITAKKLTSTGAVDLPRITIPPTFNDFRDYAPYTKIQMFIPLCGWFDLPPWCMGRTISGEMYINPYSGTVRCLVRADGNVVAELGGNAAIDLPFNATAVGMKSAAVLSNLIQTAGAVGRAVMLPTVNTLAGAGSAALGSICAMNANYTESKGTMGDGSNVYGLYHVFIKITRPATIDNEGNSLVTIPSRYCHDYGRPCNKQLTLTAGDGYTQVMDANIEGAMTDREKQMIIDGFKHGLIL